MFSEGNWSNGGKPKIRGIFGVSLKRPLGQLPLFLPMQQEELFQFPLLLPIVDLLIKSEVWPEIGVGDLNDVVSNSRGVLSLILLKLLQALCEAYPMNHFFQTLAYLRMSLVRLIAVFFPIKQWNGGAISEIKVGNLMDVEV
jgi:hypothetical protein